MKILRLVIFGATASITFMALSTTFWLVCIGLGHNSFEMLFGQTAVYVLTLTTAVEIAWFLPDELTELPLFKRLA